MKSSLRLHIKAVNQRNADEVSAMIAAMRFVLENNGVEFHETTSESQVLDVPQWMPHERRPIIGFTL